MKYIPISCIIILTVIIFYLILNTSKQNYSGFKTSKIDSLNTFIKSNNLELKKYDSLIQIQQKNLIKFNIRLEKLNADTKTNLNHYEKELNHLNSLTDSLLIIEFTNTFDYD